MNTYKLSSLNPIQFHQPLVGNFAYNKIPSFEYQKGYNQIYFPGDRPYIQILSDIPNAVITMHLVDINDVIKKTWSVWSYGTYGTYFVYHWSNYFSYSTEVANGLYFLRIDIADSDGHVNLYSEPIYLVDSYLNTLRIVYTHDQNEFDTLFVGMIPFMLRVEGGVRSEGLQPGGKFTMFQDLDYQSVLLQSQPFNVEKFTFGQSSGIPNHLGEKLNRIFGLTTVTIDGVGYSRNENAKIEREGTPGYPLAVWSLDLVKTANPYSDSFEVNPLVPFTADNSIILSDSTLQTADQTLY